ncbi:MAG: SCO family protein [Bacteriovoracaceae bacterium]|jgi:protein SCO1|nr:SCO family protein [Bacteriovoracaceae bacterium]
MELSAGKIRQDNKLQKVLASKWFWVLSICFLFSYPLIRAVNRELPPPRPTLYQVPEFTLKNEMNKPFGSKDLKGKVYVASFFFTSCSATCPKLMAKMQKIQKRVRGLRQTIALVSFTVDPEEDSPEKLFKFSRKYKANPYIWRFLTGEREVLTKLLVKGFKVPMSGVKDPDIVDLAHTEKFVLVDKVGGIKGYYGTDQSGIDRMMIDIGLLANGI